MDRIQLGHAIALVLVAAALALCVRYRGRVTRAIVAFFRADGEAFDLGVWRFVLFGALYELAARGGSDPTFYNRVPRALWSPIPGWAWIQGPLPDAFCHAAQQGLLLFSLLACVGLFTRFSAWMASLCAFVALGLPHFFTKIDHYHHLIWFATILAASRCGDRFSLDAVYASWRRGGTDDLAPPGRSRAYGLPLRCTWFLLGLLYFFPGFFKLWTIGLNWPLGDALRYQMYEIWSKWDGFSPTFRVDRFPVLMTLAGAGTILFEVGFVFAIIPRVTRYWAAAGGVGFHSGCGLFMHTPFLSLLVCYPGFVPWRRALGRVGTFAAPQPLVMGADLTKDRARRVVALLRELDWADRIEWSGALPPGTARLDGRTLEGTRAVRAAARRVPALWPLLRSSVRAWRAFSARARPLRRGRLPSDRRACAP
jgi:hypothetical protein